MNVIAPPAIAIDGPAASGKSTVGKLLAEHLGYLLLDTGSMYRAATLAALESGIDMDDETAVTLLTQQTVIDIQPAGAEGYGHGNDGHDNDGHGNDGHGNDGHDNDGRLYTVRLDGRDITWELRTPAVDRHVSQVSAYPEVRRILVERQREIAKRFRVVMVGRDIGTVVLPEAKLKLYIIASAEERAERRCAERHKQGLSVDYASVLADVIRRDSFDSSRRHSPLRPAADAVLLDSTGKSPQMLLQEILSLAHFQTGEPAAV
jgi:CMP/dCMP kinase